MFQFNQLRPQLTSSPSPAKGVSGLQFPLLLMEYLGGIMDLTGVNSTWVGDPAIVAGDVANSNIKALGYGQVLVNWLGLDLWLRLRRCLNIYLVHAHIIIYNYLYNIFICVCAGYVCTFFTIYIYIYIFIYIYIYIFIYIYILYYCTIYHDLWPSLVGSNRVQGSRDIGKSANPKCLAFFDSTLLESAGLASVCSSIGARLCQHPKGFCCTHIAPLHQYSADRISHDKPWLINRDGSSKRSRWRIESRCCMGCEPFMTF